VRDATNEETVEFDGLVRVVTAPGEPRILLTAPATDVTAALGAGHEIEILWTDEDTDPSTTITLRYDDDPMPDESGETGAAEVTIEAGIDADPDADDEPPPPVNPDRWEWDWHPSDITLPAVGAGDYYIFAYIGNSGDPVVSPDQLAVAAGMVTIPNTRPELEFTTPGAADVEFDSDSATNDIAWNQRDPDAADSTITIDLFLDPDDTFDNDNEYRIANNYTAGSPFAWDGTSIDHGDVDTGPYRVVAVIDTPSNNEQTISSDTLINYRPDASSAVIALSTLFDPQSVDNGDPFTITWADLSPAGNETVTLEYDTDSDPSTPGTVIVSGLPANADGENDAYEWIVNAPVDSEVYIHARIKNSGGVDQDVSTSKAKLSVGGTGVATTLDFLTPTAAGVDVAINLVSGTTADVDNGGGGGPFVLTDAGADFVNDGVLAGDAVRITSGGGSTTAGVYGISSVDNATTLTLDSDAGDSGGAGNVNYSIRQSVDIIWDYQSNQAGVISLEVDPDTTNNNANDVTIVSNRAQPAAPSGATDTFTWELVNTAGNDVATGIYNVRGILNVPDSPLRTALADGQVRLRKTADAPLVTMNQPTSNTSFDEDEVPNTEIAISWTVDSLGGSPKVDIWFDTQSSEEASAGVLAEGAALSALAGLGNTAGIIAEDIDATPAAYTWNPADEGDSFITNVGGRTYYIHIRIRDASLPDDDDRATARGKITINN
jgi:hypothetical protein